MRISATAPKNCFRTNRSLESSAAYQKNPPISP
jgi:hypothetical protein